MTETKDASIAHRPIDEERRGLQQGDVVKYITNGVRPDEVWEQHLGVVVTATCDIVNRKSGGIVTLVPLVPLETYVVEMIVPAVLQAEYVKAQEGLSSALQDVGVPFSLERIDELLRRGTDANAICDRVPGEVSDVLRSTVTWYEIATRAVVTLTADLSDCVGALTDVYEAREALEPGTKKKSALERVCAELASRVSTSPGDAFKVFSPAPGFTEPYVAYLRLLREVGVAKVALEMRAGKPWPSDSLVLRVGRLTTSHTHRLTQQMAQVFTEIGLPDDHHRAYGAAAKSVLHYERFSR